jgi:ssDNA-binding Zn-finger/Zn-ribbon topoisomerase 1
MGRHIFMGNSLDGLHERMEMNELRKDLVHDAKCEKPARKEAGACKCGGKFVLRQNRKNKEYFYGCSNYPKCTKTREVDIDIIDI